MNKEEPELEIGFGLLAFDGAGRDQSAEKSDGEMRSDKNTERQI